MEGLMMREPVYERLCRDAYMKAFYSEFYSAAATNEYWENVASEKFKEQYNFDNITPHMLSNPYDWVVKWQHKGKSDAHFLVRDLVQMAITLQNPSMALEKASKSLQKAILMSKVTNIPHLKKKEDNDE